VKNSGATATTSKKHLPIWLETLVLLAVAILIAIVLKTFFVQAFYIPSPSMVPGLVKNDRILVEKPSYWFGEPQRGDVVVFEDPGDWLLGEDSGPKGTVATGLSKIGLYPAGGHLVKRVIGVGGDTIVCCDDQGRISVNGQPLDEDDYVNQPATSDCRGPQGPGGAQACSWTAGPVPAGDLFVMGDNRYDSRDSSAHMCQTDDVGCTPGDEFFSRDLVVGKVFAVMLPRDHATWLHRPDTFADVPDAP
jgi:signal peptidase I